MEAHRSICRTYLGLRLPTAGSWVTTWLMQALEGQKRKPPSLLAKEREKSFCPEAALKNGCAETG